MLRYCITDRSLLSQPAPPPLTGTTDPRSAPALNNSHDHSLDGLLARIIQLAPSIDYIQIRERDLSAAALEKFTRRVLASVAPLPHSPRVLINHRADVALSCAASTAPEKIPGVHLRSGPGELSPAQIRTLYSACQLPPPIISLSCHTLEDIHRAADQKVDLILFGPVFEKPLPNFESLAGVGLSLSGTGLDRLAAACRAAAPIPALALGGVTAANTASCLAAGAAGIAGIRLFLNPIALSPAAILP